MNPEFLVVLLSIESIGGDIVNMMSDVLGSTVLLGVLLFIFFFVLTLILGLGMLVGSVVLLPAMFMVFEFAPDFKIFVAIILGLLFGMALNKIVRR